MNKKTSLLDLILDLWDKSVEIRQARREAILGAAKPKPTSMDRSKEEEVLPDKLVTTKRKYLKDISVETA